MLYSACKTSQSGSWTDVVAISFYLLTLVLIGQYTMVESAVQYVKGPVTPTGGVLLRVNPPYVHMYCNIGLCKEPQTHKEI